MKSESADSSEKIGMAPSSKERARHQAIRMEREAKVSEDASPLYYDEEYPRAIAPIDTPHKHSHRHNHVHDVDDGDEKPPERSHHHTCKGHHKHRHSSRSEKGK
jgi:hypothetical protein